MSAMATSQILAAGYVGLAIGFCLGVVTAGLLFARRRRG